MTGGEGLACVPGKEAEFEQALKLAAEYAQALGVKRVNVLPGRCLDPAKHAQYLTVFMGNLSKAATYMAKHHILVTFEAVNTKDMPGFLIHSTEQMLDVLAQLNHPNLKMQFDIYHMQLMEGHVEKTITQYGDLIGHIQFADTPNRGEPLTGNLNFNNIFDSIHFSHYHGYVAAEYNPTVTTEDSLKWMQQFDLTWLNSQATVK
jgi:hydroxypyruvate isomerase